MFEIQKRGLTISLEYRNSNYPVLLPLISSISIEILSSGVHPIIQVQGKSIDDLRSAVSAQIEKTGSSVVMVIYFYDHLGNPANLSLTYIIDKNQFLNHPDSVEFMMDPIFHQLLEKNIAI